MSRIIIRQRIVGGKIIENSIKRTGWLIEETNHVNLLDEEREWVVWAGLEQQSLPGFRRFRLDPNEPLLLVDQDFGDTNRIITQAFIIRKPYLRAWQQATGNHNWKIEIKWSSRFIIIAAFQ